METDDSTGHISGFFGRGYKNYLTKNGRLFHHQKGGPLLYARGNKEQ